MGQNEQNLKMHSSTFLFNSHAMLFVSYQNFSARIKAIKYFNKISLSAIKTGALFLTGGKSRSIFKTCVIWEYDRVND